MTNHAKTRIILVNLIIALITLIPVISLASSVNGTIENQYAWGENVGWVNFLPTDGDINITDFRLSGHAWDQNYGWINLAPDEGGVLNDGEGNLSGHAWSSGGGYIDFSGVIINSVGRFTGIANGVVYGRLTFDCDQCSVTTDWRPLSVRPSTGSSGGSVSVLETSVIVADTVNLPIADIVSDWVDNLFGETREKQRGNQNQMGEQVDTTIISPDNSTLTQVQSQTDDVIKAKKENILSKYWSKIVNVFAVIASLVLVLKLLIFKI